MSEFLVGVLAAMAIGCLILSHYCAYLHGRIVERLTNMDKP